MNKLTLFISVLLCLTSCTTALSRYHEYFVHEHPGTFGSVQRSTPSQSHTGTLRSLPDPSAYTGLITEIREAKHRIWIEIYTWTSLPDLQSAIIDAHKRGVDVRIILEPNVYGTPTINHTTANAIRSAGIPLVYADNYRYTFTHAKFWVIDDRVSISTGNWTKSFFDKNREYIYTTDDPVVVTGLVALFERDFAGLGYKDIREISSGIAISPINARSSIEGLVSSAKKSLRIFVQSIDDDSIFHRIDALESQGVDVILCGADNLTNTYAKAEHPNYRWLTATKPYLHAKIIIVDDQQIFIGSQNLTTNALDNNREVGIILSGATDLITIVQGDIQKDCK